MPYVTAQRAAQLAREPQNMGCTHPPDKIVKSCLHCGDGGTCFNHVVVDVCKLCGRHRCNDWHC